MIKTKRHGSKKRLIRPKIKKAKNLRKRKLAVVLAIILSVSLISAIFAGYFIGFSNVGNALKFATKSGIKTVITPVTGHVLKVLVVTTCNDDGTLCSSAPNGNIMSGIYRTNLIYKNSNSKIKFVLDPRSNVQGEFTNNMKDFINTNTINNTYLNQDCIIPSGVIPEKITKKDVNNDGKFNSEDVKLVCDPTMRRAARTAYALNYPDAVVVFARGNPIEAKYDEAAGHWYIAKATGGSSGCGSSYINMPFDFDSFGNLFAHESGHYLCSPHTFRAAPQTVEDAAKIIKDYIIKKHITNIADTGAVLRVFDFDAGFNIYDTPPDPGTALFKIQYGDECKKFPKGSSEYKGIQIPVYFSPKVQKTYVLSPNRENIMSYYKGCGSDFSFHFTLDQNKRHEMAISTYHKCFINPATCSSNSNKLLTADAKITAKPSVDELNNLIALRSKNIADGIRSGQKLSVTVTDKEIFPNPVDILPSITAEEELEKPAQSE